MKRKIFLFHQIPLENHQNLVMFQKVCQLCYQLGKERKDASKKTKKERLGHEDGEEAYFEFQRYPARQVKTKSELQKVS